MRLKFALIGMKKEQRRQQRCVRRNAEGQPRHALHAKAMQRQHHAAALSAIARTQQPLWPVKQRTNPAAASTASSSDAYPYGEASAPVRLLQVCVFPLPVFAFIDQRAVQPAERAEAGGLRAEMRALILPATPA